MIHLGIWLTVACAASIVAMPAAACTVRSSKMRLGQDSTYSMIVTAGESCGHTPRTGDDAMFEAVTVMQRPRIGQAGVAGAGSIAYLAPAGRAGSDRFVVEIRGQRSGQQVRSLLTFDVTITP